MYVSNINGVIVVVVYSKAVTVSSCFIRHYIMKTYGEEEYQLHIFFTWEPDGDKPPSFYTRKRSHRYSLNGDLGGSVNSVWT
jgi:hypothetical protein